VIKNERQHRITRAHAEKFRATLNELAATPRPKNVHPKLWEAQKAGLKSQLQDLEAELQEYETLKTGGPQEFLNWIPSRDCRRCSFKRASRRDGRRRI
jgi:hypothetical protein